MTNQKLLALLNSELQHRATDWWEHPVPVHPARRIRLIGRAAAFAELAQDAELLERRQRLLERWGFQ